MAYTNSPLVNYTLLSPNHSGLRTHSIDTITIHMVVGQCSVEALGGIFYPTSRQASSNYGVGADGRIGMYCEEKNRSWCSSSPANDQRAITIETASDTYYPYWVNDKAYNALIKLCADICKRNGKNRMVWCGTYAKTQAYSFKSTDMRMTLHKWFAATACPGYYLESHMQDIANKVNAILGMKDGWVQEDGKWYYYESNKKVTGWKKIGGKWYYMNSKGVMQTGWLTYKKNKYWLNSKGVMATGWKKIGGKRYYFEEKTSDEGKMRTGWIKLKGLWYYLDSKGVMQTGWLTLDNKKYYLLPSTGERVTGWFQGGSKKWYYFNSKGVYSKAVTEKYKPYKAVTTAELNIRKSYSSSSAKVRVLAPRTEVVILQTKKGKDNYTWGLLSNYYPNKDGWIATEYTKKK